MGTKINFIGFKLNWHVQRCTIIRNVLYWLVQVLFTISTKIVICMCISLDKIVECMQIQEIIWPSRIKVVKFRYHILYDRHQNRATRFSKKICSSEKNISATKHWLGLFLYYKRDYVPNTFHSVIRIISFTIKYNLSIYSKYSVHAFQSGNSNRIK